MINDLTQLFIQLLHAVHPLSRYVFVTATAFLILDLLRSSYDQKIEVKTRSFAWSHLIAAFAAVFALCLMVLLTSWTGGGTQDYSAIGGLLPHSDAAGYYDGAEHLLHNGLLTNWSERRPLNAAFFAARLLISGDNFYLAMILQALVVAIALFVAASVVWSLQGPSTSLIFLAINFAFINGCLYRTLSEPLGISLGLISFAVYWTAIAERSLSYYAWATLFLTLALLARAGAMFELVASIAFAPFLFSDRLRRATEATVVTIVAVGGGWALNTALVRIFGTGSSLLSNFSYVIYGLARGGKGWSQAAIDFPDLKDNEAHVSAFLYQKALESIAHNPLLLVTGLAKSVSECLITFPAHLLWLLADASDGASPWQLNHVLVPALLLASPLLYGTFCLATRRRKSVGQFHYFLFFHLAFFVASLPFFYLDGGIRLVAATFPFLAAAIALIVEGCKPVASTPRAIPKALCMAVIVLGLTIVASSLITPMIGRRLVGEAAANRAGCPAGSQRSRTSLGYGAAYINLVDSDEPSILPNIRRKEFKVSQWNETRDFWDSFKGPATWLLAYDFDSRALKMIRGPSGFANGPRRIKLLCVAPAENSTYVLRQTLD